MQDENEINEPDAVEDESSNEWEAPPPPEKIEAPEPPQMSEAGTLAGIFFEPGKTFEDLRRKPRFILALVILIILATAFSFTFYYKVGEANFRKFIAAQIDKSGRAQSMSVEDKNKGVELNLTIGKVVRYVLPVIIIIVVAIGGLIYWLGGKAFGGTGNYFHGVSVWVYASFPPLVLGTIANFIILFLKSIDDIDIGTGSQRGLVNANPSFLIDGKSMPVLATLVGTLDLFMIWGWVLAAIGLRIVNRISSGSAWAIVIILALVQVAFRVLGAVMSGNPT
jgi:membrane protein, antimicrobial resistance system